MPSEIQAQGQLSLHQIGSKIQSGQKIFLRHNHPNGFLGVNWQGKYHLAYVMSSWNPSTNQFRVLWARKGKSQHTVETLTSSDQVLLVDNNNNNDLDGDGDNILNAHVSVDHDSQYGMVYAAQIVDVLHGDFLNVNIKWESTRETQNVYLSRLFVELKNEKRKRTVTNMLGFEEKGTPTNVVKRTSSVPTAWRGDASKRPVAAKVVATTSNQKKMKAVWKKDDNEVISITSSSIDSREGWGDKHEEKKKSNKTCKEEEDEENDRKLPASIAFKTVTQTSAASSTFRPSSRSSSDDNNSESSDVNSTYNHSHGTTTTTTAMEETAKVSVPTTQQRNKNVTTISGFTQISSQIKDDIPETVSSILGDLDEVEKGSEAYIETIKDAVGLLQEELFDLNDRSQFINVPLEAKSNTSEQRGNKDRIIKMAKETYGLPDSQINDLFEKHLKYDELGYYSIHEAIPHLQRMAEEYRVLRVNFEESNHEDGSSVDVDSVEESEVGGEPAHEIAQRDFNILGRRIKTTFEDGKEYLGNITAVHYRVQYDDKDNETMTEMEVMKNLADNEVVLGYSSNMVEEFGLSSLEIFSGCSLLSNHCKRRGMKATSIDKDIDSNATIKADFFNDGVQAYLAEKIHDFIHASPECRYYSHMQGKRHRDKDNYNKTPESHEADGMLLDLFHFFEKEVKKNADVTLTLENPAAWMGKGNIMKQLYEVKLGMKPYTIYYCQFGRGEKKPTCIWTNDEVLGKILVRMGGTCKCRGRHDEQVQGTGHKNFAALPMKLCTVISDYVYTKHRQLKLKKYSEGSVAAI